MSSPFTPPFLHHTEISSIRQENKRYDLREETQMSLFTDSTVIYVENLKEQTKYLLKQLVITA